VIKPFEMAIETLAGYSGYGPAIIIFTVGAARLRASARCPANTRPRRTRA